MTFLSTFNVFTLPPQNGSIDFRKNCQKFSIDSIKAGRKFDGDKGLNLLMFK